MRDHDGTMGTLDSGNGGNCREDIQGEIPMIAYLDKKGRLIFVAVGIGGRTWGTFYRKEGPGVHRVKSPHLPMRPTRELAESDLFRYSRKNNLYPIQVEHT